MFFSVLFIRRLALALPSPDVVHPADRNATGATIKHKRTMLRAVIGILTVLEICLYRIIDLRVSRHDVRGRSSLGLANFANQLTLYISLLDSIDLSSHYC